MIENKSFARKIKEKIFFYIRWINNRNVFNQFLIWKLIILISFIVFLFFNMVISLLWSFIDANQSIKIANAIFIPFLNLEIFGIKAYYLIWIWLFVLIALLIPLFASQIYKFIWEQIIYFRNVTKRKKLQIGQNLKECTDILSSLLQIFLITFVVTLFNLFILLFFNLNNLEFSDFRKLIFITFRILFIQQQIENKRIEKTIYVKENNISVPKYPSKIEILCYDFNENQSRYLDLFNV